MNKSHIRKILKHSQKSEMQLLLENIDVQIEKSCLETNIDHLIKYADFEKGKYLFQVSRQTCFVKSGVYFIPSHDNSLRTVNKVIIDLYKYKSNNYQLSMLELRALLRRLKRKFDYDLVKIFGLECIYVDLNLFDSDLSRQTFIIDQIRRIACEIHAVFFIIRMNSTQINFIFDVIINSLMIESNLFKLQTFLPTFLNVSENAKLELVDRHQSVLSNLFTESLLIEEKRINEIYEKGLNFNIFDLLRFGHYETRLHTPFLVNLLDPNGTHNTGPDFFISFINLAFSRDFEQNKIENIEVIEELATGDLDGRIDIYISFLYKGENYYLAIENKIHACDQEKQLERYYEFLISKTTKLNYDKIKLIYLTKSGQQPSLWSISPEVFKEIQDNNVYKSMFHDEHVFNLLEDMINKNNMPERIKTLMVQYTEIIKRL